MMQFAKPMAGAVLLLLASGSASGDIVTTYNTFGPANGGFGYNWSSGAGVSGVNTSSGGFENAKAFTPTTSGWSA